MSLGRPLLAVIQERSGGDGVAYVARLLRAALAALQGDEPRVLELLPHAGDALTPRALARFSASLLAAQAMGRAEWVLFGHAGIARSQRWVPGVVRRPYAVFLHGIEAWDPEMSPARLAVVRGASLRLSNSHYTARRVVAAHPDLGPIAACPLALLDDARAAGDVDAAMLARVSETSVCMLGRMTASERYKGHDEMIDAWPAVRARVPGAQLVVVGRGDDRDRLRAKASAAGLGEDAVLFTGFVSDATRDAIVARGAAMAMPSRGEGFGLAYLDAMRAGRACIGSTEDAAGDVIIDGVTGLLVPGTGGEPLVRALVRLLADRALAARLGEEGRRRFDAEFTLDRFVARLGAVLAATPALASRAATARHLVA